MLILLFLFLLAVVAAHFGLLACLGWALGVFATLTMIGILVD